jgi:hypothetical protein
MRRDNLVCLISTSPGGVLGLSLHIRASQLDCAFLATLSLLIPAPAGSSSQTCRSTRSWRSPPMLASSSREREGSSADSLLCGSSIHGKCLKSRSLTPLLSSRVGSRPSGNPGWRGAEYKGRVWPIQGLKSISPVLYPSKMSFSLPRMDPKGTLRLAGSTKTTIVFSE